MRDSRDAGSVSILMLAVLILGAIAAFLVLSAGGLAAQRAQASAAADAAALAAADELALGHGSDAARAVAAIVASANGTTLLRCECAGGDAVVTVARDVRIIIATTLVARARAVVDFSAT